MPAIRTTTREAIKAYLEVFIERLVKDYKKRPLPTLGSPKEYLAQKSGKGQLKPFHAAIIPTSLLRINEFERGFSTSLGTTYEECAKLIARDHHAEASRSYDIEGDVSEKALNEIEHQVTVFERVADSAHVKPTLDEMIEAVLESREEGEQAHRIARADLYIRAHNGTEFSSR